MGRSTTFPAQAEAFARAGRWSSTRPGLPDQRAEVRVAPAVLPALSQRLQRRRAARHRGLVSERFSE